MRTGLRWMFLLVGLVAYAGEPLAQKVKTVEPIDGALARLYKTPAFAPLREPDRLEALPVRIMGDGLSSTFRTIEKPVALDADTMGDVRKALLDRKSYGGMTACMFTPALALRFHKGPQSVQVVLCFACGEFIFQDAAGRDLTRKMIMGEDRTLLLAAARKAFPNLLR
jgi:hypothetical protein